MPNQNKQKQNKDITCIWCNEVVVKNVKKDKWYTLHHRCSGEVTFKYSD